MQKKYIAFARFFLILLFSFVFPKTEKKVPGYTTIKISTERVQLLGVTTEKIKFRKLTKIIRTVAIAQVDETRIAHIQTKFKGWIEKLYVDFVGMPVKKKQPLFSVYSPELVSTQEEYFSALKDLENPIEGSFAEEFKKSSKNLFMASKKRLKLWDISEDQISNLTKNKKTIKALVFKSPINGIVLNKKAFLGMNVDPGMNMYTIADLSSLWVLADIYEKDIDLIKLKQVGSLTFSSFPEDVYRGEITFIDYVVEGSTRTAKIRFELENKDLKIKPGMFSSAQISVDLGIKLALPEEALIDTGMRKIVFIRKEGGIFEPREIKVGFKANNYYQILSGLSEDEEVITSSQFLIDSESRLKALSKEKMPMGSH